MIPLLSASLKTIKQIINNALRKCLGGVKNKKYANLSNMLLLYTKGSC